MSLAETLMVRHRPPGAKPAPRWRMRPEVSVPSTSRRASIISRPPETCTLFGE